MEWYGYFDDEYCVRVKSTSFQCSSSQKSNHPCLNFLAWRKLWTLQTGFWRRNWSGGASRSNKLYKKYSTAHAVWKGGNGQWSHLFKDLLWNGSWKKHRVKISAKFQFTYPFSGMNRHSCCLKLHETPQGIMEPATGSFLLSRYGSGLGRIYEAPFVWVHVPIQGNRINGTSKIPEHLPLQNDELENPYPFLWVLEVYSLNLQQLADVSWYPVYHMQMSPDKGVLISRKKAACSQSEFALPSANTIANWDLRVHIGESCTWPWSRNYLPHLRGGTRGWWKPLSQSNVKNGVCIFTFYASQHLFQNGHECEWIGWLAVVAIDWWFHPPVGMAWHGHVGWLRWTKCACCSPERRMADCNMRRYDARTVFKRCRHISELHEQIEGIQWFMIQTCQMFRTGPVRSSHGQWYDTSPNFNIFQGNGTVPLR